MDRKKRLWSVLVIMMATLLVLPACSSDDEDRGGPLVGTWSCNNHYADLISHNNDAATDTYVFKSDGTYEWSCRGWNNESGKYSYNPQSGILTRTNKKGTTWVEIIASLTNSYFVLIDEDGYRYTYTRK